MKPWCCFLIIVTTCLWNKAGAQISGVINQYTPVTGVSCNQVDVVDASFLSTSDRVLIIQMKGADIDVSNSPNFGKITDYHNSGHYEFATVTAISGNTVTLQYQLLHAYEVTGRVQLIRVPQYSNVTVSNTLTSQDWDGSTGGVLVMEVSGTLTLNAPISLNGKGFRGSFDCANPDGGCGNFQDYFYAVSSGYGAGKGEGITEVNVTMNGGRGALGNGGGGGNKHNTGGAGGSNASKGGRGGDQASFCGQLPLGGEGGWALDYSSGRIFMGGGGGSSDHNDNAGTAGGDGGGIVIIRATSIQSNNNSYIESSGTSVASQPNGIGDGAGGGGAGGTIVLDVNSFLGNLILRTSGGNGGNQQTSYSSCFGPGGGGGTGAIQSSGSGFPSNITTDFTAGVAGINLNSNSNCYLQSYGAAPGQFGPVYSFNRPLPESDVPFNGTIDMGADIETCDLSTVIDPGINATTYLWSTGETTPTITVTTSGEYWLSVTFGANTCQMRDTISVDLNSLSVDAGPYQTICIGDNVTLNATSAGNVNFNWDNGVTNNVPFSPQFSTVYTVVATDQNAACIASDSVTVTVNPLPTGTAIPSVTSGCAPLGVTFTNTTAGCLACTWTFSDGTIRNGCENQSLVFENPGCYDLSMEVTSLAGCTGTSVFQSIICVSPAPLASFYPSPIILDSENSATTMVNTSQGGSSYEWNFGDGTNPSNFFEPLHSYSPGQFDSYPISLIVTNEEGCSDTAYGMVYMEGGINYYVPNAFTPDGNEFNQVFNPVFTSGFDPSDYNFQVFNRWGEVVFESKDPQVGWDGSYHNQLAQEGVYTWRIEFKSSWNSERRLIHGHLNLLK